MGLHVSALMDRFFGSLPPARILMVGLDGAGKTTVLYKLKKPDQVVATIPGIGFYVESIEYKHVSFTVWDIGGQAQLRPLWPHYYAHADAVIYVVDGNNPARMTEAREELDKVLGDERLREASLLVFNNKVDRPRCQSTAQITDRLGLDHHSQHKGSRDWFVQSTCAITGEGIVDGLEWLAESLKRKRR